jgi:uridine phosphorylase
MEEVQYHISLKKGDAGRYVILTGDPGRVPFVAKFFDKAEKVAQNREYVTYTGTVNGIKMSVVSTGIGCPSTAICVEELARVGVDTFIRVGTAGSLQPWVKPGDLVMATGVVREEGTTRQYIPLHYPAVPDFDTLSALVNSVKKLGYSYHYGITHCKDAFYTEINQDHPMDEENAKLWTCWRKANVLATSMEASAIFILSSLKKLRAGEVVAIIGDTYDEKPFSGAKDKDEIVEKAIKTAIEAIKIMHVNDSKKIT